MRCTRQTKGKSPMCLWVCSSVLFIYVLFIWSAWMWITFGDNNTNDTLAQILAIHRTRNSKFGETHSGAICIVAFNFTFYLLLCLGFSHFLNHWNFNTANMRVVDYGVYENGFTLSSLFAFSYFSSTKTEYFVDTWDWIHNTHCSIRRKESEYDWNRLYRMHCEK